MDQDNGNDTFEGSLESPLKSIEEAIARGFSPGWLKINLLSDYHMDSVVQLNPGFHEIVSSDANAVRRITFADRVDNTDTRSPRFNSSTQMTSYRFSGIRFVAQQMAGHISNFGMIASHGVAS
ncbi:hypothetical protein, partial [Leisingera sp. MMG026]|uniref:hypothetical protein n=1 Tax=Leisingera sp. MMG026 TaxID=2909982 RepID=UPI001F38CAA3